jgi:hypothetical protein
MGSVHVGHCWPSGSYRTECIMARYLAVLEYHIYVMSFVGSSLALVNPPTPGTWLRIRARFVWKSSRTTFRCRCCGGAFTATSRSIGYVRPCGVWAWRLAQFAAQLCLRSMSLQCTTLGPAGEPMPACCEGRHSPLLEFTLHLLVATCACPTVAIDTQIERLGSMCRTMTEGCTRIPSRICIGVVCVAMLSSGCLR